MNVIALLPFLLTFCLLWGIIQKLQDDWRSAFLYASITWGSILVTITEILSLLHSITFPRVFAAWSLCFLIVLGLWFRLAGHPRKPWMRLDLSHIPLAERYLLPGGVLIAAAVGVIAWIAPPNTVDSLNYHMPRVMHWIQNRSLVYYPTHILWQLYLNAGSEFIVLHFQILADSDRFANFVQWFSMIGSAVGASLIARELGARSRGQVFCALASITIPMGILQGSSTQSDYVTAFWLVCFAWCMISAKTKWSIWSALAAGAGLGLAVLSKSTAYIYSLPFLIWFGFTILRDHRWKAITLVIAMALPFLLLNAGTYIRDMQLFGNPLGITPDPMVGGYYSNDVFSFAEVMSNVLRNVALHLGTPFSSVNSFLERGISSFHRILRISENDPRTTWPETQFHVPAISLSEDYGGNLLHLVLIVISAVILIFDRKRNKELITYAACLLFGFLVFCLYVKWQIWGSRLHLPLFVLYTPVLGNVADKLKRSWIVHGAASALILAALPWVFLNQARPLLGERSILRTDRTTLYFRHKVTVEWANVAAVRFLRNATGKQCSQVGLIMAGDDWEYPFWVLIQRNLGDDVSIESVGVRNISRKAYAEFPEQAPCAILSTIPIPTGGWTVQGKYYSLARTFDTISVLLPR